MWGVNWTLEDVPSASRIKVLVNFIDFFFLFSRERARETKQRKEGRGKGKGGGGRKGDAGEIYTIVPKLE